MNAPDDKCHECTHHRIAYSSVMCAAQTNVVRAESMRDVKSACGPEAHLFEPVEDRRYSQYE